MRMFQKQLSLQDKPPLAGGETGNSAVMGLLLDMASRMEATDEFMAQPKQPKVTGNQGPIPESSSDQDWLDVAVKRSSPRLAAGHMERSLMTTLREDESHVPKILRR